MTQPREPLNDDRRDLARVTPEVVSRLRGSGVAVHDDDSADDLVRLLDAVEEFEHAVQARGGDLMVDEPPADEIAEPDDPAFLLPSRAADESAAAYVRRLSAAAATVALRPRSAP